MAYSLCDPDWRAARKHHDRGTGPRLTITATKIGVQRANTMTEVRIMQPRVACSARSLATELMAYSHYNQGWRAACKHHERSTGPWLTITATTIGVQRVNTMAEVQDNAAASGARCPWNCVRTHGL